MLQSKLNSMSSNCNRKITRMEHIIILYLTCLRRVKGSEDKKDNLMTAKGPVWGMLALKQQLPLSFLFKRSLLQIINARISLLQNRPLAGNKQHMSESLSKNPQILQSRTPQSFRIPAKKFFFLLLQRILPNLVLQILQNSQELSFQKLFSLLNLPVLHLILYRILRVKPQ